jgi:hypothetical protein
MVVVFIHAERAAATAAAAVSSSVVALLQIRFRPR